MKGEVILKLLLTLLKEYFQIILSILIHEKKSFVLLLKVLDKCLDIHVNECVQVVNHKGYFFNNHL